MAEVSQFDPAIFTCVVCRNVLEDPVLLHCIHNACKECLQDIVTPPLTEEDEDGQKPRSVACPKCKETYTMSTKHLRRINGHLAARIAAMETKRQADRRCTVCRESRKGDVDASHLCHECNLQLCDECTRDHARFLRGHVVVAMPSEPADDGEAAAAAATQVQCCAKHGKPLSLFCKTCEEPACDSCVEVLCARSGHSYAPAEALSAAFKTELMATVERMMSSPGLQVIKQQKAQSAATLIDLQERRQAHLDELRRNRDKIVKVINDAYEREQRRLEVLTYLRYHEALRRFVAAAERGQDLDTVVLPPVVRTVEPINVEKLNEMLAKCIGVVTIQDGPAGEARGTPPAADTPPPAGRPPSADTPPRS